MAGAEPGTRALARGRAYDLLASLLAEGPVRAEHLAAVPALAPFLPEDPDEAAAEHHRVLTAELYPYESVFLDPSGLLGGQHASQVRLALAGFGVAGRDDLEPDHLANQLAALSFLCGAELDAVTDGRGGQLLRIREAQRRLLDEHLLRWLPACGVALEQLDSPLYAAAVGLLLELAADHRAGLAGAAPIWTLAEPPQLLEDPRTDLKAISRHLVCPVFAGGFLSQTALTRIGRELDLPRGFGKRWQVLENLLRSGVHYERFGDLVAALDAQLQAWQTRYRALASCGLPTGAWTERVDETRSLLERLRAGAERSAPV